MSPIDPRPRFVFCRIHGNYGTTVGPCPYCKQIETRPHPDHMVPFQKFWRCAHYPSAIENFFRPRHECEWECHKQELEWHQSGSRPMPKSWGGTPMQQSSGV